MRKLDQIGLHPAPQNLASFQWFDSKKNNMPYKNNVCSKIEISQIF